MTYENYLGFSREVLLEKCAKSCQKSGLLTV